MPMPRDAPDWRKMNRERLDRGLDNCLAVANSSGLVAGWEQRSADIRTRHLDHLDLRCGPRERNRIDSLKAPVANAPTLLFIHGGYWHNRAKEAFTLFRRSG
jgi:arylformamidase